MRKHTQTHAHTPHAYTSTTHTHTHARTTLHQQFDFAFTNPIQFSLTTICRTSTHGLHMSLLILLTDALVSMTTMLSTVCGQLGISPIVYHLLSPIYTPVNCIITIVSWCVEGKFSHKDWICLTLCSRVLTYCV